MTTSVDFSQEGLVTLYDGEVELWFSKAAHSYVVTDHKNEKVTELPVPSATKILKMIAKGPGLEWWGINTTISFIKEKILPGKKYDEIFLENVFGEAKFIRFKTSKRATDIGSLVHNWIEDYIGRCIEGTEFEIIDPRELDGPALDAARENEKILLLPHNEESLSAIDAFLEWVDVHKVIFLWSERKVYSRKYHYAGTADVACLIDGVLTLLDFKTSSGIFNEYWLQGACYAKALEEEGHDRFKQVAVLRVPKDGQQFEVAMRKDIPKLFKAFRGALSVKEVYEHLDADSAERKKKTKRGRKAKKK